MRRYHITWQVVLLYAALTLVFTYPVWVRPATRVLWMGDDTNLFAWTLSWDTYAFTHRPLSIFDANIYYPERYTLAYSENLIGSAFIAAPILWMTHNPILAINVVALISCVLCGIGAYVLARRVGVGPFGAVLAGIVFAFAPPRLLRLGQLHLTTVQWVPFALAGLHAYFDEGRRGDLRLAVGLFSLQALTSGHGAVFLAVSMLLLAGYRFALGDPVRPVRRLRDFGVTGVLLLAPTVLMLIPYQIVQRETGLKRTLEDWATSGASFFSSPAHVHQFVLGRLPSLRVNELAQADLFPGFLPILLAVAACAPTLRRRAADPAATASTASTASTGPTGRWRVCALVVEAFAAVGLGLAAYAAAWGPIRIAANGVRLFTVRDVFRPLLIAAICMAARWALARRVPFDPRARIAGAWQAARAGVSSLAGAAAQWPARLRGNMTVFYGLLTGLSLALSAPPPVGIWPYVYGLPGLNFIRVPSRFTILALLGIAVLAGIGFDRLARRTTPAARVAMAAAVGLLLSIELAAMPLAPSEYRVEIPPIDRWLASQPAPFSVAEVPVGNPDNTHDFERRQATFMLHSMAHWQKTIHAFSGFRPPRHEKLYALMDRFPDEDSLRALARLNITYIVVHSDLYGSGQWPGVEVRLAGFGDWLTLLHVEGAGRVYQLHAPR